MKLKTRTASELLAGLGALDGYQRIIKDGDKETAVLVPYKIDGAARRIIFRNMARLKPELEEFNKVSQDLFRQISGGRDVLDPKENPADGPLLTAYNAQNRDLLDADIEVDLKMILLSRLLGGDNEKALNNIPGSVLALLAPIITDDLDKDEGEAIPAKHKDDD